MSVTLPAGSPVGITVKTTEDALESDQPTEMVVYPLIPQPIDEGIIIGAAGALCADYGILCAPETGQDEDGVWGTGEGPFSLRGNPAEGSVQFVNVDEYVAPKDVPPTLPDPLTAKTQSDHLLALLGMPPLGLYVNDYTLNVQTVFDTTGAIIADSSFDLSMNVEYQRMVDGFPVFGPGGYITVTWGGTPADIGPQHFHRGGWHHLGSGTWHPVITELDALMQLAALGDEATIGGIPGICDAYLVDSLELAYYNTNGEYDTDILEPIYHIWGFCATPEDTLPTEVFVPALHLKPRIEITSPHEGDIFPQFDPITFICEINGGAPPYTVTWVSAATESILKTVSGVIFGDTLVCGDLPSIVRGDSILAQAVIATAVDQNGMESSDDVSVIIIPALGIDDPARPSAPLIFDLAQNNPNPFNGRTEIRYALPVESDVNLTVYDPAGRAVCTLVNARQAAGYKVINWDGRNSEGVEVSGGVYFYHLQAGTYGEVRKMVFVK
jgi:hypothetical protein